jgi:hypothetical protein
VRVGWTHKKKHKKGYHIIHFYFCLGFADWWSIHYKIKGNKKVRPEKLIQRQAKKEEINHYPYNLSDDMMNGWIELGEKKSEEIMTELKRRDKERVERIEHFMELLGNVAKK